MYSDKENVNILTALICAYGIRHCVVCPGSRNAPVVHNLSECSTLKCHPVTDERSAGFYALGMAQHLRQPVVVCVTSGSALLNLAPAVVEAYYQQLPLIVVSTDRPAQWIGQQDGQTMPQPDALGHFVRLAVSLPEPNDEEQRWFCNRLVNQALMAARLGPVHINVPISEPLFQFTVKSLVPQRVIESHPSQMSADTVELITQRFMQARRPLLICGQPLNNGLDELACLIEDQEELIPDFILYTGGCIVSKRAKRLFRKAAETWVVNATGEVVDTFMNLTGVLQGDGEAVVKAINSQLSITAHPFVNRWKQMLLDIRRQAEDYQPQYSQMAVVKYLESQLDCCREPVSAIHYANSSSVRLANIYAHHPICCNRGVNGIEGSVSTAAGCSLVAERRVICVTGDLSFFYDQNALWNTELKGNLRILLLNNGGGGIFTQLAGLEKSPVRNRLIAGCHTTSAEGICSQNGVAYRSVADMDAMQTGVNWLIHQTSERPMLLEVFTHAEQDAETVRDYYRQLHL